MRRRKLSSRFRCRRLCGVSPCWQGRPANFLWLHFSGPKHAPLIAGGS
ncbi:uncharacterized protein BCN122_II0472 [Burkholderia cenocepacia]|nr:uncharacterized protein BCN122_II0472 [Burkholderia cenocepacia]